MNTVVQEPIQLKTEKVEKLKTSIIIEDQTGTQYTFVLDQDKSFKSMFIAYAKCLGVQKSALRFIYDGERIDEELSVDKYNKVLTKLSATPDPPAPKSTEPPVGISTS